MLIIEKNKVNTIALTLKEMNSANYYTLSLLNQLNQKNYIVPLTITSNTRIDLAIIEEVSVVNENQKNSKINLPVGMYNYTVYTADSKNLAITGSTVEKGIAQVIGEESNTYSLGYMETSGRTQNFLGEIITIEEEEEEGKGNILSI